MPLNDINQNRVCKLQQEFFNIYYRILMFAQVMGNKIHCHVVEDEYGARITNIQMYDSIRLVGNDA